MDLARRQQLPLALLRMVIGWHFLYEGWAKFMQPGWTSAGYLKSSTGPFAACFHSLGASDRLVSLVDVFNIWGLVLIGLALMLGFAVRHAAAGGMALLALYYLAHPPLFAALTRGFNEGSYLIVNKNLVEFFALLAVFYMPAAEYGIQAFLRKDAQPGSVTRDTAVPAILGPIPRRQAVAALVGVPVFGAFVLAVLKRHGWQSFEELQLGGRVQGKDEFVTSATLKSFQFSSVSDLKGGFPTAASATST